jgi:hypothetical protein
MKRRVNMRHRLGVPIRVTALLLCASAVHFTATADAAREQPISLEKSCDYSCLTGLVDRYLTALAAHDPRQIPVADHVKFTENTIPLKLGDALWGTMSGMGTYKLYFADPQAGQAGLEATIRENGTPAILLLRLRVVNRKITEVETLVHRNAEDAEALEKRGQPNPVWLQPLEASQKTSRQEILKAVNLYFEGILHSSGDMVPFDPRCDRMLDGYQDTNNPAAKGWFDMGSFRPDSMGIRENMNTGIWTYIRSIEPRRFVVVDEKMGIVLGMLTFNHPGTVESADVPGVGKVPMPAIARRPSSVEAGEFFKIEGGKIRQIEGVTIALPCGSRTGWETSEREY